MPKLPAALLLLLTSGFVLKIQLETVAPQAENAAKLAAPFIKYYQ